jgi:pilus assembly protein CpaF
LRAEGSTPREGRAFELAVQVETKSGRVRRGRFAPGKEVWFGRDAECHFVLGSQSVSRKHLSARLEGRWLLLQDHSANGTLVGDHRLHGAELRLDHPEIVAEVGPFRVTLRRNERAKVGAQPAVAAAPQADAPPAADAACGRVPAQEAAALNGSGKPRTAGANVRRRIHAELLDHLELSKLKVGSAPDDALRGNVRRALEHIVHAHRDELADVDPAALISDLVDEALGLGPLERLLGDPKFSEIMVVDPMTIYAERAGRLELTELAFTDGEAVRAAIERIVTPLGRRIDESTPLVDARLRDGSRVNAIIPPLATRGPCITIRKFPERSLTVENLVEFGSLTEPMARFLTRSVRIRKNVVISGGTGSGKTTLLNVLSSAIPEAERIITIEDAAELKLGQPHVVSLESRPPNLEGKGEYTIRDLVKNALRMRPDRIVVGECRGGEALDMLQAMNTGHEGSMTTTHANSPREALGRIETLCLMAGVELPLQAIRRQISSSVHLIVQQSRLSDGSRKVTSIAEVTGLTDSGDVALEELFTFQRTGTGPDGAVLGEYRATGRIPTFMDELIRHGVASAGDFL